MKLKPLGTKLKTGMSKKLRRTYSARFRNDVICDTGDADSLVMLGDGDVDDIVIPVICHHLNGTGVAAVAKPEHPRIGALNELQTVVKRVGADKIALIMDQEGDELAQIREQVGARLRRMNVRFQQDEVLAKVVHYRCTMGSRRFELILIVSGREDVRVRAHKIEDHLVRFIQSPQEFSDSKEVWKKVDEDTRKEVLRKLLEEEACREAFPQHFVGLNLLKSHY